MMGVGCWVLGVGLASAEGVHLNKHIVLQNILVRNRVCQKVYARH